MAVTRQHVASNICGYFDLVSNMLPEIEQPSGLHTRGNLLPATKQHVARNRTAFYSWQHVAYKIKVTTNVARCCLVYVGLKRLKI